MTRPIPFLLFFLLLLAAPAEQAEVSTVTLEVGEHVIACVNGQAPVFVPPDRAICPPVPTATPTSTPTPAPTATPVPGFLATFDGQPAAPAPWRPADWDVAVHSRDRETWVLLDSMAAGHGPGCEPPPGQHTNNTYEGAVFLCRDHVMTAIRASGYGVIYLTPNQMVDFSQGEAVVRFDVSTLRTSNRDWWDVWITPYEDNLQAPLEDWLPDLNGEPRRAIHIRMRFGSAGNLTGSFEGYVINGFDDTPLPQARTTGYEFKFTPSATTRRTFELRISQTHIRFGMPLGEPLGDLWWIDTPIAPLGWNQAVVQLGHHSYNPMKDCAACTPNTWHWDNVYIEPAVPFTIIPASRRYIDPTSPEPLTFAQPAPAGAHLRFSGIGNSLEISTNGGATWIAAVLQAQEETSSDHFRTYWTPIPAGVDEVLIRGQNWWGGRWHACDITIWAR